LCKITTIAVPGYVWIGLDEAGSAFRKGLQRLQWHRLGAGQTTRHAWAPTFSRAL
jgi:hypothetical protein